MTLLDKILATEPGSPNPLTAGAETLAILLAVPALGLWLRPADPLFLQADFPWLLFACLLPALRYGFAYGFFSAMALIGLLALAAQRQWWGVERFPAAYSFGLLLVAMLVGEFVDLWMKREVRQRIVNSYQRMRLEEFTRTYHLLKVSHDRMEHRLAAGTVSLREALMELRRRLMLRVEGATLPTESGQQILRLFADYVSVRVAALYPVDAADHIGPTPIARLGQTQGPSDHPMVRQAAREGCLVSIRDVLDNADLGASGPLVAVPVADVAGRTHAVLVIEDLPFLVLQEENLRLLATLGGHVGDILTLAVAKEGADADSVRFRRELERAIVDQQRYRLASMLVRLQLPLSEKADAIEAILLRQVRGLDCVWVHHGPAVTTLLLLMPLTSLLDYSGYQQRIDRVLLEKMGAQSAELGVEIQAREIASSDRMEELLAPYQTSGDGGQ